MSKLIIGCGYLGLRVARRWRSAGHAVCGVVRGANHAEELTAEGIQAVLADVTEPETLARLPSAETVLCSVGYDPTCGKSRWDVYVEGVKNLLRVLAPSTRRLILLSSTGVYGEAGEGWVDEESPCRPTRESARALLAAEEVLHAHPLGRRGMVLRLAGVYGPGRLPRAADIARGSALAVSADACLNLIHVEDAAAVVEAAEQRGRAPRTYLVSDGHPVRRREYYRFLAEILGAAPPRFIDPPRGSAETRGRESKRVDNRRMLDELNVRLLYPSYREGLRASLAATQLPGHCARTNAE